MENTLHLGYRNQSICVIQGNVAVCFEVNTRHQNTVWAEYTFLLMLDLLMHQITCKFILEQATKVQRGISGIVLLFL